MSNTVISYSLTGNNRALADSVAKELSAEHIKIEEVKSRTMGSIVLDIIFNKIPMVRPLPNSTIKACDLIVLLGPVWMGKVATPLRLYLKYLKTHPCSYAFISISGGADGSNPGIAGELEKRTGRAPAVLLDLHITGLLPSNPRPTRKATSAYRLKPDDIVKLTGKIMTALSP